MVECTLSITHCLRLNLQLHRTIDLVRTCRILSSFCTVAWQLARFQLTRRIARSLGDSWASSLSLLYIVVCYLSWWNKDYRFLRFLADAALDLRFICVNSDSTAGPQKTLSALRGGGGGLGSATPRMIYGDDDRESCSCRGAGAGWRHYPSIYRVNCESDRPLT